MQNYLSKTLSKISKNIFLKISLHFLVAILSDMRIIVLLLIMREECAFLCKHALFQQFGATF